MWGKNKWKKGEREKNKKIGKRKMKEGKKKKRKREK